MHFWKSSPGARSLSSRSTRGKSRLHIEALERRDLLSANPLPALLVIADKQDFYYREYDDTRTSLLNAGVDVVVAATTTDVSIPHPFSGQPFDSDGAVTPDIALEDVNAADYSAIVFVGGWGSSMYQYAYNDPNADGVADNFYWHWPYNGDDNIHDGVIAPQKVIVNNLINEFLAADKPVAAICHAVTVLAWARVDGASPLEGRQVSVPLTVGSPNQFYDGAERVYPYSSGQYDQVVANGGIANVVSGQYGLPGTATDDVVVDGRIITAENFDSAAYFGTVIAQEVLAALPPDEVDPVNQAPIVSDTVWSLPENSAGGTAVGTVFASDPDAGQSLSFSIVGGNVGGAFFIDPVTGALVVANASALNYEVTPQFTLTVRVVDDGTPAEEAFASVVVHLTDVYEPVAMIDGNLVVAGTSNPDVICVWSNGGPPGSVSAWINGTAYGPFQIGPGGHVRVYGGSGNDQIFASDLHVPVRAFGGDGHDQITGGWANDYLDGGAGVDRLWGAAGDDFLRGGDGDDYLHGREGNDILLGEAGNDLLEGLSGRDLLLGGLGYDCVRGGDGEDLLIGGTTVHDQDAAALEALRAIWTGSEALDARLARLSDPAATLRLSLGETVFDDGSLDCLWGGTGDDWLLTIAADYVYALEAGDRLTSA